MALLTKELQEQVVKLLVSEGLVSAEQIRAAQEEVLKTRQPILALLTSKRITDDETVSHATAMVMKVPYVNLNNVRMDQEILTLIPHEVAERSMVVPLGEKGGALYVAMLDAQNVQSINTGSKANSYSYGERKRPSCSTFAVYG